MKYFPSFRRSLRIQHLCNFTECPCLWLENCNSQVTLLVLFVVSFVLPWTLWRILLSLTWDHASTSYSKKSGVCSPARDFLVFALQCHQIRSDCLHIQSCLKKNTMTCAKCPPSSCNIFQNEISVDSVCLHACCIWCVLSWTLDDTFQVAETESCASDTTGELLLPMSWKLQLTVISLFQQQLLKT